MRLWNAETGKEVLNHSGPFSRLAFSPIEDVVVIATAKGPVVFSLVDGHEIAHLAHSGDAGMWFVEDGQVLLTMTVSSGRREIIRSDGTLDSVAETPIVTLKAVSSKTWTEAPHPLNEIGPLYFWAAVSRNAKLVASFVIKEGDQVAITIWDVATGDVVATPDVEAPYVFMPEFTSNDQLLLVPDARTTVDKTSRLWNVMQDQWLEERAYIYPRSGFSAHFWPYSVSPTLTVEATEQLIIVRDSLTDQIKTQFPRPKSWDPVLMDLFNTFPYGKGSHLLNERTLVVAYPETTGGKHSQTSSLDFVDLREGIITTTLVNHEFLAGSRTGKYFATRDAVKKINVLWCESDKTKFTTLPVSGSLQFSPNEETFATTHKGNVKIWSIQSVLSEASSRD